MRMVELNRFSLSFPISSVLEPEVAEWLEKYAGIYTLGDLLAVYKNSPKTLKKNQAIWKAIQPILKKLEEIDAEEIFLSVQDIFKQVKEEPRISTGIEKLDQYLDPAKKMGLPAGTSLEAFGEASSGKSELMATMIGFAFLPQPYGLGSPDVYIVDTEGVWAKTNSMILKIANVLRGRICHPNPSEALAKIKITTAYDVEDLLFVLQKLLERVDENSLVVIDSIASPLRLSLPGPENMQLRTQKVSQILFYLKKMQAKEATILLTNQVYANIGYFSGKLPYGGEKLKHFATYRVQMKKASGSTPKGISPRTIKLVDVIGAPEEEIPIAITSYGVVDFDKAVGRDKNCSEFPKCDCEKYGSLFSS